MPASSQKTLGASISVGPRLVELGVDVEKANDSGTTPLIAACKWGQMDIVKLLVELGVDLNKSDEEGKTALWWAKDDGEWGIARYLKDNGADDYRN